MGKRHESMSCDLYVSSHSWSQQEAVSMIPFKLSVCRSRRSPMESGRVFNRFFSTFRIWQTHNTHTRMVSSIHSLISSVSWLEARIALPAVTSASQCPLEESWACCHADPKPLKANRFCQAFLSQWCSSIIFTNVPNEQVVRNVYCNNSHLNVPSLLVSSLHHL